MAQRHVLLMLAATATSFLEGQSDRTGAGYANAIGSGLDRRCWTGKRREHTEDGCGKDTGCHPAIEEACH